MSQPAPRSASYEELLSLGEDTRAEILAGQVVVVPAWRRERLPNPGTQRPVRVVPDWVCELTSPTSASRDRVAKKQLYARHGVPDYWLVDPEARTLEALELNDGRWTELGAWDDTAVAAVRPFEEVSLEIGRLFLPKDQ